MATPEIKAKLVLVTEGGVGGGGSGGGSPFTASEERGFRLEESQANRATSRYLPLLALMGAGASGVGLATLGLNAVAEVTGANELPEEAQTQLDDWANALEEAVDPILDESDLREDLNDGIDRNTVAMEELEASGKGAESGLQTLADGSIILTDEFGNVVEAFGGGMAEMQLQMTELQTAISAVTTEFSWLITGLGSVKDSILSFVSNLGSGSSSSSLSQPGSPNLSQYMDPSLNNALVNLTNERYGGQR